MFKSPRSVSVAPGMSINIPHGGWLHHYFKEWCSITHDREILSNIAGIKIPFTDKLVLQAHIPREIPMNFDQARFVDSKIEQLLRDQCIKKLDKSICSGWISNIFLTPKHDVSLLDSFWIWSPWTNSFNILNLKWIQFIMLWICFTNLGISRA